MCDRPPAVDNGVVHLIQYGESVIYSCNQGYTLKGNSTRDCQESGEWSGQQPICEGKQGSARVNQKGGANQPCGPGGS